MDDFGGKLGAVFENYIGRIVTFVLTPILVVAVPPVTNALNDVLGTGFDDQQISNIAIATVVGLALVVWRWLGNRGDWENKLAELHMLYESGAAEVAKHPVDPHPVEPPSGGGDVPAGSDPKPTGAVGGKPGF